MENYEEKTCRICGGTFYGYGHNPYPVRKSGECCLRCFDGMVAPARWKEYNNAKWTSVEKKKKVYISGAIAHHDLEERREAFRNAERWLELKGFEPVNPFKNGLPEEAHWREHMRADIRLLLGCGYIYMLQGWELSKGAKLELDVASSCGIEVLFEHDTGMAWHGN